MDGRTELGKDNNMTKFIKNYKRGDDVKGHDRLRPEGAQFITKDTELQYK